MVEATREVFGIRSKEYLQPAMVNDKITQVLYPELDPTKWGMKTFSASQAPNFRDTGLGFGLIMGKAYYIAAGNANGETLCKLPSDWELVESSAYYKVTIQNTTSTAYQDTVVKVEKSGIIVVDDGLNLIQDAFIALDGIVVPLK